VHWGNLSSFAATREYLLSTKSSSALAIVSAFAAVRFVSLLKNNVTVRQWAAIPRRHPGWKKGCLICFDFRDRSNYFSLHWCCVKNVGGVLTRTLGYQSARVLLSRRSTMTSTRSGQMYIDSLTTFWGQWTYLRIHTFIPKDSYFSIRSFLVACWKNWCIISQEEIICLFIQCQPFIKHLESVVFAIFEVVAGKQPVKKTVYVECLLTAYKRHITWISQTFYFNISFHIFLALLLLSLQQPSMIASEHLRAFCFSEKSDQNLRTLNLWATGQKVLTGAMAWYMLRSHRFIHVKVTVTDFLLGFVAQQLQKSSTSSSTGFPNLLWPCTPSAFFWWACTPKIFYDTKVE